MEDKMRRLYYLFKSVGDIGSVSDDLHDAGFGDENIHFLSSDVGALQATHNFHPNLYDETDIGRWVTFGVMAGGLLGIAGAAGSYYLLSAIMLNIYVAFGIAVFITIIGGWIGAVIGMLSSNHHLTEFKQAIRDGCTLLMLDAYNDREEEKAKQIMRSRHTEANLARIDKNYSEPF